MEYSDYLMHYGVKGMKWGVRRYQNKDGTLTSAGKQHIKDMKNDQKLIKSNGDYILKKGTVVQRVSDNLEDKTHDYTYVSFTKHDNDFYDKNFTDKILIDDYDKTVYKHNFKITKDLKVSSSETNKEIFLEMYKERTDELINSMATSRRIADINYNPLTYKFKGSNDVYKGDYMKAYNDAVKFYTERYSKMTVKQLQEDAYYDFMNSISDNESVRSAFFDKLKSRGYNAIMDDNDSSGLGARGYDDNARAKYPLIILDAPDVLERGNSSTISGPLSKEEARKRYYT